MRKIDIATNKEVWRYKFDDIIKGSSTIYIDQKASAENRIVILQGSRSGGGGKKVVPSFRAISLVLPYLPLLNYYQESAKQVKLAFQN